MVQRTCSVPIEALSERTPAIVKWSPSRSEFSTSTRDRVLVRGTGAIRYLVEESPYLAATATLDESRVLRILVAPDLLPVTRLETSDELAAALRGIFKGYRRLYETIGTLHRDIAAANLRFYLPNGKLCGVLRDFDFAIPPNQSMAKYLNPPYHLYRHDLKSFVHVLAFLTVNTDVARGKSSKTWAHLPVCALRAEKNLAMTEGFPDPYVEFDELYDAWLTPLTNLFSDGLRRAKEYRDALRLAERKHIAPPGPFANDTLTGSITFDKFAEILDTPLLPPPSI
ncbi:hypothetical protein C8R46DRAFT_1218081 [Mycena filopes]|nr:hypothetical protein C8R46DRAFT_1218081 [Mycena filopes]